MSSVRTASTRPEADDKTFDNPCDPCNYEGSKAESVKFCSAPVSDANTLPEVDDKTSDNLCDPCNYEGSKIVAVKFCSDCKEWLCSKCTDSHRKFKASRNHKVLSVAQVPSHEIGASQIQSYKSKRRLFNDMKVQSSSQVKVLLPGQPYVPNITGCEALPNGQIIMCDCENKNLRLLHSSFTVKEVFELQGKPWDVSVNNNSSAIITLPWLKQLQYMQLEPSLKSGRVIQLDKKCWGIAVAGEYIYITLHNEPGEGEVRILDMEGSLKRRIGEKQAGSHMFIMPSYLTQNATTGKIYVSDTDTNTVTCLMSDGSTVYQYKDKDLKWPRGVCVDDEENIIVCGRGSANVQIVTASGRKLGCLLTSRDGINNPMSVAYRDTDDTLIIGCWALKNLLVYMIG